MWLAYSATYQRKKEPPRVYVFFMAFFFLLACAYSHFNVLMEADFLSGEKYGTQDTQYFYAEKQSNLDAVFFSPVLFHPLAGIIFEFLPSFASPNTLATLGLSVLRC
jgi:hypothetical protein